MNGPFDQEDERRFVARVLDRKPEDVVVFEQRIRCVPRIMAALNARRGRPFRPEEVDDLAQDTMVIAVRKLPEYEPLAPLEGWLHRLCVYEFFNALRRRDRDRRVVSATDEVESRTAEDTDTAAHDEVHLALEQLGGLEAEIIRLKHFEGLTFVEIAARTEASENTVKTRYYRGIDRLEALLVRINSREEQR